MASAILHSTSKPVRKASRNCAPEIRRRSPSASAAAKGGMVGCVIRPKMRSALVESWVSSKSRAWPLVPFRSAAEAALVRNGSGPNTVASARALPGRVYARRIALALVTEPASMTPSPSITQRFARSTASGGKSAHRAPSMKSSTSRVAAVGGTGHIMCAPAAHGNRAFGNLGAVIGAEQWESLRGDLEKQTTAEVRVDRISRALYSPHASGYPIEPRGGVLPKSRADLIRIVQLCAASRCSLTLRGGGTSQAGQAIGAGLIVDTSKYLNRLLALNVSERWA